MSVAYAPNPSPEPEFWSPTLELGFASVAEVERGDLVTKMVLFQRWHNHCGKLQWRRVPTLPFGTDLA